MGSEIFLVTESLLCVPVVLFFFSKYQFLAAEEEVSQLETNPFRIVFVVMKERVTWRRRKRQKCLVMVPNRG